MSDDECQISCNNPACNYDDGKCLCSPNCPQDLLYNDICDRACNIEVCDFDNNVCVRTRQGYCNSGCFPEMLGDGTCDESCNVSSCSYDISDCCNCTDEELSSCDTKCLVASCAYDTECDNQFMKDSAKYSQLLKADLTAILDFEECFAIDSSCTIDQLHAFYDGSGNNFDLCRPEECLGQYGLAQCCAESMHCKRCIGDKCIECEDGYYNYYTSCVSLCPFGFTKIPKVLGICYCKRYTDITDTSSETRYTKIQVGDPANNSRYTNLVDALASTWNAYTKLEIVESSVVFSPLLESESTFSVSIYNPLEKTQPLTTRRVLVIESSLCNALDGCKKAEIRVRDRLMTLIVQNFKLVIKNVIVTGQYAFKSDCSDPYCSYCPYLTEREGYFYSDKFTKYESKPDWNDCTDIDTSFIEVACGAELSLVDFNLTTFKLKQAAFITASGSISITKSGFYDISSAGSNLAFIIQSCSSCSDCTFEMNDVDIKYFNNGFELNDELSQPGFLRVSGSKSATITQLSILKSVIYSTSSKAMFAFDSMLGPVVITKSNFFYIACNCPMITYLYPTLPPKHVEVDSDNYSIESKQFQVWLEDIEISYVSVYYIVYMRMQSVLKKIKMINVNIHDSLAYISLIDIGILNFPTSTEISGGLVTQYVDSKKQAYFVEKMVCQFNWVILKRAYWGAYAITTSNLANQSIRGIEITDSGMYSLDLNTITIKSLIADQDFYLSKPLILTANIVSLGTLNFDNVYSLKAEFLFFRGLNCYGSTGLAANMWMDVRNMQVIVNFVESSNNYSFGSNSSGSVVSLSAYTQQLKATLTGLTVSSLITNGAGAVTVSQMALSLTDSQFTNIVTELSSGVTCSLCGGFFGQNLTFSSLASSSSVGACLKISLNVSSMLTLQILDSSFMNCSVQEYWGGALIFESFSRPVTLQLSRLVFTNNSSQQSGSALYLSSNAFTLSGSYIKDCTFTKHLDSSNSVVDINIGASLAITNCVFKQNSNERSVLQLRLASGIVEVSIVNTQFENNRGVVIFDISGKGTSSTMKLTSTTVVNNLAALGEINDMNLIVNDSLFSFATGPFIFTTTSVTMRSITISNFSNAISSALELYDSSSLDCEGCIFTDNDGDSGASLRVDSSSQVWIRKSKFLRNAGNLGSTIYFINTKQSNLIEDTEFAYNTARSSATIYIVMSSLTLNNVTLHSNTALTNPAVYCQSSSLMALKSKFFNQTGVEGSTFVFASSSNGVLKECSMSDLNGGAITMLSSALSIQDSSVKNSNNDVSSFISTQGSCSVSVVNCQIEGVTAIAEGSFLYFRGGDLEILSSKIAHFNTTALMVSSADKVTIQDSTIECKALRRRELLQQLRRLYPKR